MCAGDLGLKYGLTVWVACSPWRVHAIPVAEMSEPTLIAAVERRLTSKYAQVPPEQISSVVHNAYARFEQSRTRDFVPLLVERRAREQLAALREGTMADLSSG